jgi:Zn-dependent protease
MALFSFSELIDMVIMTAAVGFIFSDMFQKYSRKSDYEPLDHYQRGFDWEAFRFAAYVTAPAIILHEFGHKFVGLAVGLSATFHAAYKWLLFGVVLKLFNSPFLFFVPAYVSLSGNATPLMYALTAFAGPAINGLLWGGALLCHKQKWLHKKYNTGLLLTAKINMFLFIFNMLPIPGFDGSKVYMGLWQVFF